MVETVSGLHDSNLPDGQFPGEQLQALRAAFFHVRETHAACHIYLLLDDGKPVAIDHPLHPECLTTRAISRRSVRVAPETADGEWRPLLVQLYCSRENGYVDEKLIDLSLTTALERCASINGAYVAAWIASDLSPEALAAQLTRNTQLFDTSVGREHRVPLFEPHRMALLLDDPLSIDFRRHYFANIALWAFVDCAGILRSGATQESSITQLPQARHLSLAQCRAQTRVPVARRVVMGLKKAAIPVPARAEQRIDSLLLAASSHGLSDSEDVVFFALNSLSLSPRWHEHPVATQLIAKSKDDAAPLSGLFAELDDQSLAEIAEFGQPLA